MSVAVDAGLYGKLPARGDFVRAGMPTHFVAPWDSWLQAALSSSQAQLGASWRAAWLEAPVWRFALAPGLCGPHAVLGLWLPSVDRVGRYFPLTLAAFPLAAAGAGPDDADAWLAAAEEAGRAALARDAAPDEIAALLPPAPPWAGAPHRGSLWWTDGGPRVAATRRTFNAMPGPEAFAAMLTDPPIERNAAGSDAR